MLACAAFTSDDFPMPRAPHNSALLAGSPSAKRSVFSIRMSRIRSIPLSRPRSTRLTRGTGASRPSGCQTKASAPANERVASGAGEAAESRAAIASSAHAILSVVSCSGLVAGRFAAAEGDFRAARALVFGGFFDIFGVPDASLHIGPCGGLQATQMYAK